MSRRKAKSTDATKNKITAGGKAPFFRCYADLFYSRAFQELSANAKLLFFAMGLEEKGRGEFIFPCSCYSRIMTKDTFIRSRQQLVDNGFIEIVKHYRTLPNVYRLSDRWKTKTV